MRRLHIIYKVFTAAALLSAAVLLPSCQETKLVADGDRLFVGLDKITYSDYDKKSDHAASTREEVDAALQTAPNGALFGSSYYRSPIRYGLWVWNAFADKESKTAKWITKAFGDRPVLMSQVNPELRASVAKTVLSNHGYFNGQVTYKEIDRKNPKKAKLSYDVKMNELYTIDTLTYSGFPADADSIIKANADEANVKAGSPFDASLLSSERERVSTLLRDNGYYYYQGDYASYLADTLQHHGRGVLDMRLASYTPEQAKHRWYIGNVTIDLRKSMREELSDSIHHRHLTIRFNGKKPPIRPGVLFKDLKIRPKEEFSYTNYKESMARINSSGSFSSTDFRFTPRDTTAACDTLDFQLNCLFDKPYDFYVETNYINKTNGRTGPQLIIGLDKRNAFRGGEKLSIDLNGSVEWQSTRGIKGLLKPNNENTSYEYGFGVALELPRFLNPFRDKDKPRKRGRRRTFYYVFPTTIMKVSANTINRAGYFRMHTVSGQFTYSWQKTATSAHELSPLIVDYQFKNSTTHDFDSIVEVNPYLKVSMANQFIVKMKYSYVYKSPNNYRNPILWSSSVSEAGNLLSLGWMAFGKGWNTEKKMFKTPFAQFFKLETSLRKTWSLTDDAQLVGNIAGGVIFSYGNSSTAPYSEQFYAGGANGVRAFQVRSIGPGSYVSPQEKLSYVEQTGDFKLLGNLELRYHLFGSLYTALFLDAGNVWTLKTDDYREGAKLKMSSFFNDVALGTGMGIRYDLGFLILRLDWGIALHAPYDTGKSGYFNINRFKDGQCLHFAVGMPF